MESLVRESINKFQVFNSVICWIMILVVDKHSRGNIAVMFSPHEKMLELGINADITFRIDRTRAVLSSP
jgi:hypothetical protein